MKDQNVLNIVVPMAGAGKSFIQAGYSVPKPLIDVQGVPMIEKVIKNLTPSIPHKFFFIVRNDQYDRYPMSEVFYKATNGNFEVIQLNNIPQGAACTVLTAIDKINNVDELLIANGDQIIDTSIDLFIEFVRTANAAAAMITFDASHPKWSFVRLNKNHEVIETAEKKVISSHATSGIYYYNQGSLFVEAALTMIEKDIRFNNEFYVAPAFNEIILRNEKVLAWEINRRQMHSMGTAEDLAKYLHFLELNGERKNGNAKIRITPRNKPKIKVVKM